MAASDREVKINIRKKYDGKVMKAERAFRSKADAQAYERREKRSHVTKIVPIPLKNGQRGYAVFLGKI